MGQFPSCLLLKFFRFLFVRSYCFIRTEICEKSEAVNKFNKICKQRLRKIPGRIIYCLNLLMYLVFRI